MRITGKQMKLGAFIRNTGHHAAAWRLPRTEAAGGLSLAHFRELVLTAERAKFDMFFLPDGLAIWRADNPEALARSGHIVHFEPLTLLAALSQVTSHIGLVATASTTYDEPYHVARRFASLDHLSGGRAGWNVVTSVEDAEARNFGRDHHLDHEVRYSRAREFLSVTKGLWDTWEDDAFVRDKQSGLYADLKKLHILDHSGEHFAVKGPLNISRPPQGYPVIIQAGASETGRDFAAEVAEVVFTAQNSLPDAQVFYSDIRSRAEVCGRDPDGLVVMPGLFPVLGTSEEDAAARLSEMQDLIHPTVGIALLGWLLGGLDLSQYPVDGPLPEIPPTNLARGRLELIKTLAGRIPGTIRDLYEAVSVARGHLTVCGTADQIADTMEEWFLSGAADGFNVMPPWLPGGLTEFTESVVPILQKRGLFRRRYEGTTLREHLGLTRPQHPAALTGPRASTRVNRRV